MTPQTGLSTNLEEKSAAPMAAMDKMLAMLGDLSERMDRLEISQVQAGEKHNGSTKSIFGLALEVGEEMNLRALERTPPPKMSTNASPATYFGARRHNHGNACG